MSTPPNIVYVIVHDLGRHLGCYGIPVASPHLDAFADEAILFRNAYCSAPVCCPSRVCAMTGQYSHVNGVIGPAHRGWALREDQKTIVDYLNEGGYRTLHFGLSHERHPLNIGLSDPHPSMWSRSRSYPEHGDPVTADEVYVPPYLPDTPGTRESLGRFQAAIRFLDREFGRFVERADALGFGRNTVFHFSADHGAETGWWRDKTTCYGKGLEIALLARMPDGLGAGRVVDELVPNIDLAPTVLELAGLPVPGDMNGRTLKPLLLDDGTYQPHEAIFFERNVHDRFDPVRCVRTRHYHYMRNYRPEALDYDPLPFQLPPGYRDDEQPDLPLTARPEEELYDLRTDPMEFFNLAQRPELGAVKDGLVSRMARWMRETDDFLLRGEEPQPHAPPGFLGWQPIDTIESAKRWAPRIPTPE